MTRTNHPHPRIHRREFIAGVGSAALLGGTLGLGGGEAHAAGESRVVVVTGTDPLAMLQSAMKVFRGMGTLVGGKRVVIKPNMAFKNPAAWGNNTSPEVARAVAQLCVEGKASEVTAVDHTMGAAGQSIRACGVGPALEAVKGVKVLSLHQRADYSKRRLPRGKQLKSAEVWKGLTGDAVLINVPVAKHHGATKVSFGLKNLMGLVWDRAHFHQMINLHQGIADLATLVTPALTVIDATRVMVSNGPQGPGKVQELRTLVVSTDPLAADAVALGLTQWDGQTHKVEDIEHFKLAALLGVGQADLSKIKVVKKKV